MLTYPFLPSKVRVAATAALIAVHSLVTGCIPDPSQFEANDEVEPTKPPIQQDEPEPVAGFQIVDVQPASGPPKGLQLVEIRGGGFREDARVIFGGSEALDVTVTSAGLIYALTPPYVPATVSVVVVNPDASQAELSAAYRYENSLEFDAIEPSLGPISGGTPVRVTGSGLAGTEAVLFEGREALKVQVIDDTQLLAITPPGYRPGSSHLHIVTGTRAVKFSNAFSYFEEPAVEGMAPLHSAPSGGGTLTLTGSGLVAEATVSIGDATAPVLATSDDASRLVVRIPANEEGRYDIVVSTVHGQIRMPEAFVYRTTDSLELVNVWPQSGTALGGDEVSLAVVGLESAQGLIVRFGGEPAKLRAFDVDQDLILVRSPVGTPGALADIEVSLDAGDTTLDDVWRWTPSLSVTDISPDRGPSDGGTRVEIRGQGFETENLYVRLGALPVGGLDVVDDSLLSFTTPPGSPGYASLRISTDSASVKLPDAYVYEAGETLVWAVEPDYGSIAGNTLVTAYGTDLPDGVTVLFGGTAATDVVQLSPNIIAFRAPRADAIGPVDIRLSGDGLETTLADAYTYFDPKGLFGGTWGGPVDRSLNVTVLQSGSDEPLPSTLVALGGEDVPRFLGYTDDRGQLTLSDFDLRGRQTVTVAKTGYGASTVAAFDAENVTLFLPGVSEPGGAGNSVPLFPGRVEGTLTVPGKYVLMPPWQCKDTVEPHDGLCQPCQVDANCSVSAPHCTRTTNQAPFCSSACVDDGDCLALGEAADGNQNFICSPLLTTTGGRCVPNPGRAEARCYVSSSSVLGALAAPDPLAVIPLDSSQRTFSIDNARLGEVAVYCLAGSVRVIDSVEYFEPTAMGLARHQTVSPGEASPELTMPTEVQVTIDIPLDRSVNVVIGPQPLAPTGPHRTEIRASIDLGSDGYVPLRSNQVSPDALDATFRGLPRDLSGELADVSYAFHASSSSNEPNILPTSDVLRHGIDTLDDGRWLQGVNGVWGWRTDGYPGDVLSVEVLTDGRAFATTSDGQILTWSGGQWTSQPITAGEALHDIADNYSGGLLAVGDRGRILRWDGSGWSIETSGTQATLRGVASLGAEAAIVVGDYVILESSGTGWTNVAYGPPKELEAVSTVPQSDAWAVGRHGVVLKRGATEGGWGAEIVPVYSDLHDVWNTSDGDVVAVGDEGTILRRGSDGEWFTDDAPNRRNLRAVYGRSVHDIWVVGDAGVILHFDGASWSQQGASDDAISLRAIGAAATGGDLFALGMHAVHLDPFLTIPRFIEPTSGALWSMRRIHWTDAGGNPSFLSMRIYDATGSLAWTVMAPAFASDIELPNIGAYEPGVLSPGPKRLYLYEVDHTNFDIDGYDNRVFRLLDWHAWAQATMPFDNPAVPVPSP